MPLMIGLQCNGLLCKPYVLLVKLMFGLIYDRCSGCQGNREIRSVFDFMSVSGGIIALIALKLSL